MKKVALAIMACLSFSFINASMSMDDRIYISSRDVVVADNGIYVNLDGTLVEVEEIGYDSTGINIRSSSIKSELFGKDACATCEEGRKKREKEAQEAQRKLEEERKKQKELNNKNT